MFKRVTHRRLLLIAGFVLLAAAINLGPHVGRLLAGKDTSGLSVWGANNFGQTGNGTSTYEAIKPFGHQPQMPAARQVALGINHSLALSEDGKVYGWGSNQYGQIGQNTAVKFRDRPAMVGGLPEIRQIAASQDHSVALASDGSVYTWGLNMSGQLGDGTNTDSSRPKRVEGVTGVKQVIAGYRTTLALKHDGSLWAWGGDCRLESNRDESFRAHVVALSVDGAYSTPSSAGAKTGRYTAISPEEDCINQDVVGIKSVRPKKIDGLPRLRTVSAGFGQMLAIDESDAVWAWGCNTYGQVGNGTVGRGVGANLRPAKVSGMSDAAAVSAGFRHSLVLKRDGTLWAWGHNFAGELGTGIKEDQNPRPARVQGVPALREIAAGHDFSLAIARSGEVWGWGDGTAWQFSSKPELVRKPVRVWGLKDVAGIHAGGGHAAAWLATSDNREASRR